MTARWLASAGCLSPFGQRDIADKLLLGGEHITNRSKARVDELSNLERYERIARFYDLLDLPFEYGRYRKIRPLLWTHAGPEVRKRTGTLRVNCNLTERHHGRHIELGG